MTTAATLTTTTALPDEYITTSEVASMTGLKPNTFEIWRHQGKGPPFYKLGDGRGAAVRYLRSEVLAWIEKRQYVSTSHFTAKQGLTAAQRPRVQVLHSTPAPNAPWLRANA